MDNIKKQEALDLIKDSRYLEALPLLANLINEDDTGEIAYYLGVVTEKGLFDISGAEKWYKQATDKGFKVATKEEYVEEDSKHLDLFDSFPSWMKGNVFDLIFMKDYGHKRKYADQLLKEGKHKEALEIYEGLAKLGDDASQFNAGLIYYKGIGTNIDYQKAFNYFNLASEFFCDEAYLFLGMCYLNGQGVTKDENVGIKWIRKGASVNEKRATCLLGYYYYMGQFIEKDLDKAIYWLKRSANQNYAQSYYFLGLIYQFENKYKDHKLAIKSFEKGANLGSNECKSALENL